jgi:Domain of unknown function (DUF4432)
METLINLSPSFFSDREKTLVSYGSLSASVFLFESGVAGLRLKHDRGELVMLPYQGQQIWSAVMDGRNITMKSMFDEPLPTQTYLETYGAFLVHCGVTAMGGPGPQDKHPLHGELPNAPFQKAYIVLGHDAKGSYMGLGGVYQHTVAFSSNYLAKPLVKLYEDSSIFEVSLEVENLKNTPMELMYLAHINYRPVNNGRLVYSSPCTPERVRVRTNIPSHLSPPKSYKALLEKIAANPEIHNVLKPNLAFDPEVVLYIDYLADEQGWGHTLQVLPNGTADYVKHKPKQLDHGVRWICRTPDQDALGMIEAATAEPEGYTAEKAKGNIKVVKPKGTWRCDMEMGTLTAKDAAKVEKVVNRINRKVKK